MSVHIEYICHIIVPNVISIVSFNKKMPFIFVFFSGVSSTTAKKPKRQPKEMPRQTNKNDKVRSSTILLTKM